jgi:hypothetical protein
VQSDAKTDSSWVVSSCLTSAIVDCTTTFTDAFMEASREAIVALSCCTSCWVSRKPDCKVLKRDSSSWLRVWAMRMGELKRERAGSEIFVEK